MGDPDEPEHTLAPSAKTAIKAPLLRGAGAMMSCCLCCCCCRRRPASNVQACSRCGVEARQGKARQGEASRVWMHTFDFAHSPLWGRGRGRGTGERVSYAVPRDEGCLSALVERGREVSVMLSGMLAAAACMPRPQLWHPPANGEIGSAVVNNGSREIG